MGQGLSIVKYEPLDQTVRRAAADRDGRRLVKGPDGIVRSFPGDATDQEIAEGMSDRAEKALLYGAAARSLTALVQSPAFRTRITGPMKDMLADALASQSTGRILSAIGKISSAMPAQYRPQLAPQ